MIHLEAFLASYDFNGISLSLVLRYAGGGVFFSFSFFFSNVDSYGKYLPLPFFLVFPESDQQCNLDEYVPFYLNKPDVNLRGPCWIVRNAGRLSQMSNVKS